jgi:putative membrane protein
MKQSYRSLPSFPSSRAAFAAAVLGVTALSAAAQANRPATVPPSATPPSTTAEPLPAEGFRSVDATPAPDREDERFISRFSMLHDESARLSAIASQRATSEQVRTFAEQLRVSGQGIEQELAQLAQSRSVAIPTGKDANDLAEESEDWQKKDADDFDEDYVQRVIKIQKNSIEALEDYSDDNDSDPELAAFAQKHLPALRETLRQAESLEKQVD